MVGGCRRVCTDEPGSRSGYRLGSYLVRCTGVSSMNNGLREIAYVDAGVEALREEMRRDETIVYIGQGIGPRGGNFRQTRGLWQEFGDHRLRDTGVCELGATGIAIGAA